MKTILRIFLFVTLTLAALAADRSAFVAWQANPAEEGVTSYRVYVSTNQTGQFTLAATATGTSVVVTNLQANVPYWFTVSAVNGCGESEPSTPVAFLPVPTKPVRVQAMGLITLTNVITIPFEVP